MNAAPRWPEPPALIEGVRLRLRRIRPDDAQALHELLDDADVMRYLDWPRPTHVADTRTHLLAVDERWQRGQEHQYLALRKPDGVATSGLATRSVAIGSLAFRPRAHSADFGCVFGRAHWGQGLGSEAVALLVGWLQRQPVLLRLWATCDAEHRASARVLEKAGLQREALMRRASLRPNLGGAVRDTLLYAWVREEEISA